MSDRNCGVWNIGLTRWRRWRDQLVYGHSVHRCMLMQPFMALHNGHHHCRCGKQYD